MRLTRAGALTALALAVVATATLTPAEPSNGTTALCILCDERGMADVLANLLLFLPIGIGFASCGLRVSRTIALGALLSAAIELAQITIVPGRDASVRDLLANTLGTALGVGLVASAPWWLRPPQRRARWLALGAATLGALSLVLAGFLLQPAFPRDVQYYGQWTPRRARQAVYRGRLTEARVGSVDLPSRQLVDPDSVRALLDAGAPLTIRAIAGPSPPRLAPLFSIHDARRRLVVLIGADGTDLVYQYRMRAASLHLDHPDVRWPNVLASARPGDSLHITVGPDRRGYCLTLNQEHACARGLGIARGWTIVWSPATIPAWLRSVLDATFLATLVLPFAFWAREARAWAGGGAVLLSAVGLAVLAENLPFPGAVEGAGAAAGLVAGRIAHRLSRRHATPLQVERLQPSENRVDKRGQRRALGQNE